MAKFKDIIDIFGTYETLVRPDSAFDFTAVAKSLVGNETWRGTSSDSFWGILGECANDLNNVVSDGVVEYIRNLSDINTARIPALSSMAKALGGDISGIYDTYRSFPVKLQLVVDVLGVDREWLFSAVEKPLGTAMVRELMERRKATLTAIPEAQRTPEAQRELDDLISCFSENSHALGKSEYRRFLTGVFEEFVLEVLSSKYSENGGSIADNMLYEELADWTRYVEVPRDTAVDRAVNGEARLPLDLITTSGTAIPMSDYPTSQDTVLSLAGQIDSIRASLGIPASFDAFSAADMVIDHGMSPSGLGDDERMLVEAVLNAHNKEKFDYARGMYVSDWETRFAYYREREFVSYLRAFLMLYNMANTVISVDSGREFVKGEVLSCSVSRASVLDMFNYVDKDWTFEDGSSVPTGTVDCAPKFVPRTGNSWAGSPDYEYVMSYGELGRRNTELDETKPDVLRVVCERLVDFVEGVLAARNRLKTLAQRNAVRGTGAMLSHMINEYLLDTFNPGLFEGLEPPMWAEDSAYDKKRRELKEKYKDDPAGLANALAELEARIKERQELYRSFGNVTIVEYMDPTDYFNVRPTSLGENDQDGSLTRQYWEDLRTMTSRSDAQLGVLSADEIHDFYVDVLGAKDLPDVGAGDYVEDFLTSLYESGATDISVKDGGLDHPIDDVSIPDYMFAFGSAEERAKVQDNKALAEAQDRQFARYNGNTLANYLPTAVGNSGSVIAAYNWKNSVYSSVMLHPFMYAFQLWNPVACVIANAFSSVPGPELEKMIASKHSFDDLYGEYGESKNFWKHNVVDCTGYMTRYEKETHGALDFSGEVSPLTGYDGVFYPSAVQEFVEAYVESKHAEEESRKCLVPRTKLGISIFAVSVAEDDRAEAYAGMDRFGRALASVYWQIPEFDGEMTFYGRWYAHLNESEYRLKSTAKRLWYWRERIVDMAVNRYAVRNYSLDIANNSFFLVDTFKNEKPCSDKNFVREIPDAVKALDANISASNERAHSTLCDFGNSAGGYCVLDDLRPAELWIRWNSEPIAMPAFDVYWDNDAIPERSQELEGLSPLAQNAKNEDFGQLKYMNSSANDGFHDAIEDFKSNYALCGQNPENVVGNKAPVVFSFERRGEAFVFSMWGRVPEKKTTEAGYDRTRFTPLHLVCKETQSYNITTGQQEYQLEPLAKDLSRIDSLAHGMLSAPYVVCASHGSILVPMYRNVSPAPEEGESEEDALAGQALEVRIDEIACDSGFSLASYGKLRIALNSNSLFAGSIVQSRNTNVLFSVCENKAKFKTELSFAFLGRVPVSGRDILCKNFVGGVSSYEADSDPTIAISLLRKKYYEAGTLFSDPRIHKSDGDGGTSGIWNSYDRNDKYLCVVQYAEDFSVSNWNSVQASHPENFSARLLNLVSDASYIPCFSYRSPNDSENRVSGENVLWKSSHFSQKDHWATQLLGLECRNTAEYAEIAQNMIIRDETAGVDTFVDPAAVADGIFRIWEEVDTDDSFKLSRILNPQMELDEDGEAVWIEKWTADEEGRDAFLGMKLSLFRSDPATGEILNSKDYILPPTGISCIMSDVSAQDMEGWTRLMLDPFYTAGLSEDGSYSMSSRMVVGTQDPFKYAENPDYAGALTSPAYILQYGNGIAGVREMLAKVEILDNDGPDAEDRPYLCIVRVKFRKYIGGEEDSSAASSYDELIEQFMEKTTIVPAKSVMLVLSEDDVVHAADYHMLTHHDDVFYNVPTSQEELSARLGESDGILDYIYVKDGSAAFKIDEESEGGNPPYNWSHPENPLDELLRNFRRDQRNLNSLSQWCTFVTQADNPSERKFDSVGMNVRQARDCKAREDRSGTDLDRLIYDSFDARSPEFEVEGSSLSETMSEIVDNGYSFHVWEDAGEGEYMEVEFSGDLAEEAFDSAMKIYVCYQKIDDDSERGHHFDLFFNVQNLFKTPFEYMSSVTGRPAPVVLPDSWAWVPGDEKSLAENEGKRLTLYAQAKYMTDNVTSSVKTVELVSYDVYNISDDKPKFLLKRVVLPRQAESRRHEMTIIFHDALAENAEIGPDGLLTNDATAVQAVSILNSSVVGDPNSRLDFLSFAIAKSSISGNTILLDVDATKAYYDKDKDVPARYVPEFCDISENNGKYLVSMSYGEGSTNENMYLVWKIPFGTNIVDLYTKLGCVSRVTALNASARMKSGMNANIRVVPGEINIKDFMEDSSSSAAVGSKRLGIEHGRAMSKLGFILTPAGDKIRLAE